MVQAVEHLPSKHETLNSNPSTAKKKKTCELNSTAFLKRLNTRILWASFQGYKNSSTYANKLT
jgi:hypothetical protein